MGLFQMDDLTSQFLLLLVQNLKVRLVMIEDSSAKLLKHDITLVDLIGGLSAPPRVFF